MSEASRARGFYSCDWGTSSFRLRLVDASTGAVLAEVSDAKGARALHEEALMGGTDSLETRRAALFEKHLLSTLTQLENEYPEPTQTFGGVDAPILVSGMASSQIGWKTLPYAPVPFRIDGSNAILESWTLPESIAEKPASQPGRTVVLVSGVCSDTDVLRGEETELVGLFSDDESGQRAGSVLVIFPGTHSKHLKVERGVLVEITTFMTGELFELAATRSILAATTEWPPSGDLDRQAFEHGVSRGVREGVLGASFGARTRALLQNRTKASNTAYLLGVFLGSELAPLASRAGVEPILLAATEKFSHTYRIALEIVLGPKGIPVQAAQPQQMKRAVIQAHRQWFRQFNGAHRARSE